MALRLRKVTLHTHHLNKDTALRRQVRQVRQVHTIRVLHKAIRLPSTDTPLQASSIKVLHLRATHHSNHIRHKDSSMVRRANSVTDLLSHPLLAMCPVRWPQVTQARTQMFFARQ